MNIDVDTILEPFTGLVRDHLALERQVPVRSPQPAESLRAGLAPEEHGASLNDVMQQLSEILRLTPSTASDKFFNQLFAGRDGAAVLGELLATVLNNSMYTYKVAGVHVLIEQELVKRMGAMMGYTRAGGVFTPGGSLSNFCALIVARNEVAAKMRDQGAPATRLRLYTSDQSHYSVGKAAGLAGMGRNHVVRIPTDRRGRMIAAKLDAAITADKAAGHTPVMINATAGTTVLGAFDPLDAIADVAEKHGVWLHVDGAYGGSLRFDPAWDEHFAGIERSDSITWDAHKMMGVPLTCSVIMVRERGLLHKHFDESASYLFQDDSAQLNPGTRSIQCGRRNDALKLWTAWKVHGDEGYRERMRHFRRITLHARNRVVAEADLTLVREPESLNLVFSVRDVPADTLCTRLNTTGRAMVGYAIVDEVPVIRAVFLGTHTDESDVDVLIDEILRTANEMR